MKIAQSEVESEAPGALPGPSLTPHQFTRLAIAGKIVDGRAGGLIFGRSHEEGGILALFRLGSGYVVHGRVEGGEFAVNWKAATRNMARLHAMNAGLTKGKAPAPDAPLPPISQLIITVAEPDDRLIYFHWGQMVVSKEATIKHITELAEMNRTPNPYLSCDLRRVFNLESSADGVV